MYGDRHFPMTGRGQEGAAELWSGEKACDSGPGSGGAAGREESRSEIATGKKGP